MSDASSGSLEGIASVGIFRMDARGACGYVNAAWVELTGMSRANAMGDGWIGALHPEDRDAVVALWRDSAHAGEVRGRARVLRPDGTIVWVLAEAHAVPDASGQVTSFLGSLTDITSLMEAQEALTREKERTEMLIRSSLDGILAVDENLHYTAWNPAMEALSGLPASEVIGHHAVERFPFLAEIGEDVYMRRALAGHRSISRDQRYMIPSTDRTGYFEARYSPVRDASGRVVGALGIVRDTTELKQTQAQLVQAGKLAAMGQLGAGIAHELNQPLTGLQILVELVRSRSTARVADVDEDLVLIADQIERMGRIVDNVRTFAREGEFAPQSTTARACADDALTLMSEQLRLAGVEVQREFPEDPLYIHADPMRLQQVYLNLLSNALHALGGRPDAMVRMGAGDVGEAVELWVQDNGPGIPENTRARVFDPFFTTKDPGQGTGLGLSLCYGIVREHGGEIRFEAPQEGGARFVIRMPRAASPPVDGPEHQTSPRQTSRARILIVDDEPLVRRVVARSVEKMNHDPTTCSNAPEALALLEAESFDLAVIDLKMPRIGGQELCARIREIRPDLPLIVMSGFVTEDDRQALAQLGVIDILPKPFRPRDLERVIEAALRR